MLRAAKPAVPTHSGIKPTRANYRKWEEVCGKKKAAAEAYFVEVMEAKRQAHHDDGKGAVIPPSVAGWSCREEKVKISVNLQSNSEKCGFSNMLVIKCALISFFLAVTMQL